MPSVSIAIQPDVFDRFSDLNFKPSQALAEFVDNAIQSYLDFKNNMTFNTNGYKLVIDIDIEWGKSSNHKTYAKKITIRDNAAGIAMEKFKNAFETGKRPAFNTGLNEYGMGMKTAAYWLSKKWTIISKSFSESIERTLDFDVDDIVKNSRTTLDFQEKQVHDNIHYTIVSLEELHQKNNFTIRMLPAIKQELASIYRAFLRRNEIQINVNQEALEFKDPELLNAPYYANPNGQSVEWKVQISKTLFGKEINGFIGILKNMSEKQSGLVIMRRGRVIVGESKDHLYHPEILFGSYKNGFVYKRLYGEIEIKGFSASFNKNGFSNMDDLESMLDLLKERLKVDNYSLIKQADKLRVNNSQGSTQKVSIRWNFNNGVPTQVDTVKFNSIIIKPTNPNKEGFVFKGWLPEVQSTAVADAEYTAQWEKKSETNPPVAPSAQTYEVCWVLNNGMQDVIETYNSGENLNILDQPHKVGYKFVNWTPTPINIVNNNATYTAKWEKIETSPNTNVIAERRFSFEGNSYKMQLVQSNPSAPLLSINMEKFATEEIVVGLLNINSLPISNKIAISEDVKNILLSIAIGMFETQMKGEDTCDALMKNIK